MSYFSIILPTRRRPKQLKLVLDNILDMTCYIDKLEICLIVDRDDPTKYNSTDTIKVYRINRGKNLVVDYYNLSSIYFTGNKYILAYNDDCLIRTLNWDKIIYPILEDCANKNNGAVLGVLDDGEDYKERSQYPFPVTNFPIISKEGVNYFGYFFNPEFKSAGAELDIIKKYWNKGCVVNLRNVCHFKHKPKEFEELKENTLDHIDLI